jgi:hypothetical protein
MGLISLVKRIGVATVAENRDVLVPQRPRRDSLHIAASARVLRVEDFEPGCEVLVPRVSKGHHFHTWCVVVGITLDKRLLVHVPGDGDVPISMHQLQREAEKLLDGPAGALLSQVNELQSRIKDLESQVARLQAASQPGTPRQHPAAPSALIAGLLVAENGECAKDPEAAAEDEAAAAEEEVAARRARNSARNTWLGCDLCGRWRRLGPMRKGELPENWTCAENSDGAYASCEVAHKRAMLTAVARLEIWGKRFMVVS